MFWPFLMIILAPNSFSLCAVPNIHVKLLNSSLSIIIGREVLKNWTERKHVKTIDKLNYASVFTDVIKSSVYDLCSLSVSFLPRAQIPPSPSPSPVKRLPRRLLATGSLLICGREWPPTRRTHSAMIWAGEATDSVLPKLHHHSIVSTSRISRMTI